MPITEFKDKTGAPIYTGDIVQWRLGKYGMKSGGPSFLQVYNSKKKGTSVRNLQSPVGRQLRASDCQYIVIVDKSEREA